MPKKSEQTRKVCGNCRYHNAYEYPDQVFCFDRFANRKNPVVSILFSCEGWEEKLQECFCLDNSTSKPKKKAK